MDLTFLLFLFVLINLLVDLAVSVVSVCPSVSTSACLKHDRDRPGVARNIKFSRNIFHKHNKKVMDWHLYRKEKSSNTQLKYNFRFRIIFGSLIIETSGLGFYHSKLVSIIPFRKYNFSQLRNYLQN